MYSLLLEEATDSDRSYLGVLQLCHRVIQPSGKGRLSDVHICGHVVGSAVVKFLDISSPPSYEIFLINTLTGARWWYDPKLPQVCQKQKIYVYVLIAYHFILPEV